MSDINADLRANLVTTAHMLADAARPVTLRWFRSAALATDNKQAGGFDPVTEADRAAEAEMRRILAAQRPDDGILGEEHGAKAGTSGLTWVLDPIDGTRGFISGTPTWGVLVAVNAGGAPLYGIIDQPHIGERFFGGFGQAAYRGPRGDTVLRTGRCQRLDQAILFSTFPGIGSDAERTAFQRLAARVQLVRYGLDCYAYALLAAGHVDLVVEAGLNAYDIQAPIAVIEAAGGIVTDWNGNPAHGGGTVIAAATAELHEQALALLSGR